MPITRDQALPLAELLCVIRPQWNTRGVLTAGLQPLEKHPAPLEVIAWAAIRAAQDPDNLTPAVIPLNGPHWNLADRPTQPRLTPEHECARHVGQWAGNCPSCRADQLAAPDTTEAWAGPPQTKADAIAKARRATADARATTSPTDAYLCNHPAPDQPNTVCRQPPGHQGEHRDYSPEDRRWPADPVAQVGDRVTP